MDVRATFSTQIALVLQRAGDRSIFLDDLDPARKNVRTATLKTIERMKTNQLSRATSLSDLGEPVTEDLAGTKNGVNTTFTLSNTPVLGSLLLVHNLAHPYRVTSAPGATEYSISGTTITMGTPPDSGDTLWAQYVKA